MRVREMVEDTHEEISHDGCRLGQRLLIRAAQRQRQVQLGLDDRPRAQFCGVCAPRDNIMLQVAIAYAAAGDVVVASAGECTEAGCFGDVLANACLTKGLGGLLTDSGAFLRGSRTAPFLRPPLGWLTGTDRT